MELFCNSFNKESFFFYKCFFYAYNYYNYTLNLINYYYRDYFYDNNILYLWIIVLFYYIDFYN